MTDAPASEDYLAREMLRKARECALESGRPKIAEMAELVDRQIAKMEADSRVWRVAYDQTGVDQVWARHLVVYQALLRFLKLVEANDKAVAAALRNPQGDSTEHRDASAAHGGMDGG